MPRRWKSFHNHRRRRATPPPLRETLARRRVRIIAPGGPGP
jgi:hypothetical protein